MRVPISALERVCDLVAVSANDSADSHHALRHTRSPLLQHQFFEVVFCATIFRGNGVSCQSKLHLKEIPDLLLQAIETRLVEMRMSYGVHALWILAFGKKQSFLAIAVHRALNR